jgi:hypothetical protein
MRWDPTREPGDRWTDLSPAEQRAADLRNSGYDGWIDQDGNAVTSYTDPLTGAEHTLPPHGFACQCSECR